MVFLFKIALITFVIVYDLSFLDIYYQIIHFNLKFKVLHFYMVLKISQFKKLHTFPIKKDEEVMKKAIITVPLANLNYVYMYEHQS